MQISFIVPVLNEQAGIVQCLERLQPHREKLSAEIILVDGGSKDDTLQLATPLVNKALNTKPSRALQMNAGAAEAQGEWLVFLHADCQLPEKFETLWLNQVMVSDRAWGRFDVRLSGRLFMLRLVERMMNIRSRLTGIATGDQAVFVRREVFERLGGYAEIPLMEDVELSTRLKKVSRPLCLSAKLVTSSRYWERKGVLRTVLLMWKLRLLYFFGVNPERLVNQYYRRSQG